MGIERLAIKANRLMADANSLQMDRSEHPPAWRRAHLFGEPAGILNVAPQPRTQRD